MEDGCAPFSLKAPARHKKGNYQQEPPTLKLAFVERDYP